MISALQTQIAQLAASVAQNQSENKTLSAKLAANRTAAAESAGTKAPGTAVKANGGIGCSDAVAQLKENLYSDLTGLIIRSVKQEAEDDVFDCIQTGRNGSKFSTLRSTQLFTDRTQPFISSLLLQMIEMRATTMQHVRTFHNLIQVGTKI